MKKGYTDNKGFTIVELIIGVAILAIVTAAIAGFIVTGTKNYTNQNTEVAIQEEAQLAVNQISDIIIDAARSVSYKEDGDNKILVVYNGQEKETTNIDGTVTTTIEHRYSNEKNYYFSYDAQAQEITYVEFDVVDGSGNEKIIPDSSDPVCLLAENVTDFKVDLSMLESKRVVTLSVTVEKRNKKYTAKTNITIRNKILYNVIDPEFINPKASLKIQMPKSVYVVDPLETLAVPKPIIVGSNIKQDKVVTIWTTSDHGSGNVDGSSGITVGEFDKDPIEVTITSTYSEGGKNYKAVAKFKIEVKRALRFPLTLTGELKAGEEVVVSAAVTGNRLGVECDVCKAATTADKHVDSTMWDYDHAVFEEISHDDTSIKLKVNEEVEDGIETKIRAYAKHSTSKGYHDLANHSVFVYGETESMSVEGGNKNKFFAQGTFKYGYTDGGFGYLNLPVNGTPLVAIRISDSPSPNHASDKVLLRKDSGNNILINADYFYVDWTKVQYVWVQVFRVPNSVLNSHAQDLNSYLVSEYTSHIDNESGAYNGKALEDVYGMNGQIVQPTAIIKYDGSIYENTPVITHSIKRGSGAKVQFEFVQMTNMYPNVSSTEYVSLALYKKQSDGSWKKIGTMPTTTAGANEKLKQNFVLSESIPDVTVNLQGKGENNIISVGNNSSANNLGDYKIVPTLVYANGQANNHSELGSNIFYMNYDRDTQVRAYELPNSTVYFSIVDGNNKYNVHKLYSVATGKIREGEIYFPLPTEDIFKNMFKFNLTSNETLTVGGGTYDFSSGGSVFKTQFSKIECNYDPIKKLYTLQFYYNYYDATWNRTEKDIPTAKYTWKAGDNEWQYAGAGRYDDGSKPTASEILKDVNVYSGNSNSGRFYKGDIYFPLPGTSDFSKYFNANSLAVQTKYNISDLSFVGDPSPEYYNFAKIVYDPSDKSVELFYNYVDPDNHNRALLVSAGKFKVNAAGTGWERVSAGLFDNAVNGNADAYYRYDGKIHFKPTMQNMQINGNNGGLYYPLPSDSDFEFNNSTPGVLQIGGKRTFKFEVHQYYYYDFTFNSITCTYDSGTDTYEIKLKLWKNQYNHGEGEVTIIYKAKSTDLGWTKVS